MTRNAFPWMTLATILATAALLLSAVADALPPEYAVPAGTAVMMLGQVCRALVLRSQTADPLELLDGVVDEADADAALGIDSGE